jgi:2-polyprenyl-3-methyl-5-hydroxy-6-metoxy-1,4-benzoquinol methylase
MSWKLKSKIQKNILVEYRYAERKKLDMGMGQGRKSVFLAMKGWEVTGFDISDEGLAVARKMPSGPELSSMLSAKPMRRSTTARIGGT